jgi:serine/threonine protein kinase
MGEIPAPLKTALADRYVIQRELGHGGMATVYLAEDLKPPCCGLWVLVNSMEAARGVLSICVWHHPT